MKVEVCIDTDGDPSLSAQAAFEGGAHTIELCRAVHQDGLTPTLDQVAAASSVFPKPGIVSILRPRAGNFCCSSEELEELLRQIPELHRVGADGISFGFLDSSHRVDINGAARAVELCRTLGLSTTFHRAFDATPDPDTALDCLIDLGIDRVLTSGTVWGSSRPATEGLDRLSATITRARDRIEVVIAGGVSVKNIPTILETLPRSSEHVSLHAFSGALGGGLTSVEAVRSLVDAATP